MGIQNWETDPYSTPWKKENTSLPILLGNKRSVPCWVSFWNFGLTPMRGWGQTWLRPNNLSLTPETTTFIRQWLVGTRTEAFGSEFSGFSRQNSLRLFSVRLCSKRVKSVEARS